LHIALSSSDEGRNQSERPPPRYDDADVAALPAVDPPESILMIREVFVVPEPIALDVPKRMSTVLPDHDNVGSEPPPFHDFGAIS
jgi:hypothetical protein